MSQFTPHLIEECPIFEFPDSKWTLQGYSRAGERTGFWLSPLNIVLDAGMVTNRIPVSLFMTHSHVDHSWNLPIIYGCRTPKIKGFETLTGRPVYAPKSAWPMVQQMEQCVENLSSGLMEDLGVEILGKQGISPVLVSAGDNFLNPPGLQNVFIETFPCYHTTETIAYGFSKVVMKLKSEYAKLEGKEIGQLRKKGIDVNEKKFVKQFIFYGDTNIDALVKHESWKEFPVVIIECTLFPNNAKKDENCAYNMGHIHWNSIFPIIKANNNIFFVLIHFSQSCSISYLSEFSKHVNEAEGVSNFHIFC